MTNKLFIGSLSFNVTDDQLKEHFAKIGNVLSAKIIVDKYSGKSKGFGFVEMATVDEAVQAMKELNNSSLDNRPIAVKESIKKAE